MEHAREAQDREAFRQAVINTLERRLFYIPSFKIYRGVAGLYDYGPPGCAVKSNVLAFWRQVCLFLFSSSVTQLYMFFTELGLLNSKGLFVLETKRGCRSDGGVPLVATKEAINFCVSC